MDMSVHSLLRTPLSSAPSPPAAGTVPAAPAVEPPERTAKSSAANAGLDSSIPLAPGTDAGSLQVRIDDDTGRMVVSVFDAQGALLRQIPAEVVLQVARRIEQAMSTRSLGLRTEA